MKSRLHKHHALLIAPASKPRDTQLLEDLAGNDEIRASEFNAAIKDEQSDLLLCARGGYGSLRILDSIDYETAEKRKKTLIGYSDITALQLALWKKSGWKSISGPMPGVDWPEENSPTMERLSQLLLADEPFLLESPNDEILAPLNKGKHEGILLGGNLSLITKLVGTEYLPDLKDCILFVEEIGEAPYQIDGHFAQLELAGHLSEIGGLVCGQFTDWDQDPEKPTLSYKEVVSHYAEKHDIPTAYNLQYGHVKVKNSMPIGVSARLSVEDEGTSLLILEKVSN